MVALFGVRIPDPPIAVCDYFSKDAGHLQGSTKWSSPKGWPRRWSCAHRACAGAVGQRSAGRDHLLQARLYMYRRRERCHAFVRSKATAAAVAYKQTAKWENQSNSGAHSAVRSKIQTMPAQALNGTKGQQHSPRTLGITRACCSGHLIIEPAGDDWHMTKLPQYGAPYEKGQWGHSFLVP